MKKIFWFWLALFLSVGLAACSSLNFDSAQQVAPGDMKVVLLNTIDSKAPKAKESVKPFYYGDMVYAYMTLGWNQNTQAKNIHVKWRNAAGAVMADQDRSPKFAQDPHHVWFWVNTAQLGKGAASVEIAVDGQAKVIPFDIVDAKPLEKKTPWYKRLFKRSQMD